MCLFSYNRNAKSRETEGSGGERGEKKEVHKFHFTQPEIDHSPKSKGIEGSGGERGEKKTRLDNVGVKERSDIGEKGNKFRRVPIKLELLPFQLLFPLLPPYDSLQIVEAINLL
ncbi:hypothetical protein CCACVL1_29547 [Corchorus capsularis]|uniref:Uncharacterized protein n=1 Tax=Corchorus capsularis TaxID=210143 RepID=A0A1R3G194_COCAP|nr:hypothetical protein CCACVL1_29547 [Corchorus capsularis]